ncbi:MAG: acyltransferase family protein, partial [Methylotenera sp.]
VIGHTYLSGGDLDKLDSTFSTIRMPFFFFISGIFFSPKKDFLSYVIYKFDVLVKPFLSIIFIFLIFHLITAGSTSVLYHQVLEMLYGSLISWPWTSIWFLPHLWIVFVFSTAVLQILNYDKQKLFLKCIFLSVLLVVGSYFISAFLNINVSFFGVNKTLHGLPFSLDLVLLTSFYFILGYTTKEFVVEFKPNYYLFFLGCVFIYMSAFHLGARIDLIQRLIHNPIFSIPSSLFGIYCGLTIAKLISKLAYIREIFLAMGVYSLFILIFHGVIHQDLMHAIFKTPMSSLEGVISLFACIMASILIGVVVSKNDFLALFFKPFKTNPLFQRRIKHATE